MKKIIAIVLSLSIFITTVSFSSFARETNTTDLESNVTIPTLWLSDVFRASNTTLGNKTADYLDGLNLTSDGLFSSFKKYSKKSLILSLLGLGLTCFTAITSNALGFVNTLYAYEYFKDKFKDGVHWFDWMHPVKNVSVNETISKLNEGLNELKGQEKAKKEIRKIVYGIAHNKNQAIFNKEEYSHGDIIYILGPSGVGKTFVSLRIAKALSNHEPFIISASEVDLQNKDTVIDQLFNFDSYNYGYGSSLKESKRLVKYLQNHKGGVVIINEYDKMWSPALDEIMRTIADQGIVNVKGQVIDCRNTTFIITSNECTQAITSGNQDKITDKDEIDDGTGSRTNTVKHDKSFLNRVKKIVFDNLTEEDYENIVKSEYGEKFKNYWRSFANFDLDLEDVYNHIAKKAVSENKGSRVINSVMDGLNKELADFACKNPIDPNSSPLKLYVSYDENKDEFTLNNEKQAVSQSQNNNIEDKNLDVSSSEKINNLPQKENLCVPNDLVDEKINVEQQNQENEKHPENIPDVFILSPN